MMRITPAYNLNDQTMDAILSDDGQSAHLYSRLYVFDEKTAKNIERKWVGDYFNQVAGHEPPATLDELNCVGWNANGMPVVRFPHEC